MFCCFISDSSMDSTFQLHFESNTIQSIFIPTGWLYQNKFSASMNDDIENYILAKFIHGKAQTGFIRSVFQLL